MTKVGKALHNVTEDVMKAGGVVTKNTGEALGELGKTLGVPENKCEHMEQNADDLGKDMYYAGAQAGRKVEKVADDMVEGAKKAFRTVAEKFKG